MIKFIKFHVKEPEHYSNGKIWMGDVYENFCDELNVRQDDIRVIGKINDTGETFISFIKNNITFNYIIKESINEIFNQMKENKNE